MKQVIIAPGKVVILFLFLLTEKCPVLAQANQGWPLEKAISWYDSREWLNGLKLDPHKVVDKQEFARQYYANKAGWDKAFSFLKNTDLNSLKPGRFPVDGDYDCSILP